MGIHSEQRHKSSSASILFEQANQLAVNDSIAGAPIANVGSVLLAILELLGPNHLVEPRVSEVNVFIAEEFRHRPKKDRLVAGLAKNANQ
jgi:hypothetical protein